VASDAPGQLPQSLALPQAIVAAGHAHLAHRALPDFERLYADMEPPNFVWYLSRLHLAARDLYQAGGPETVRRMWRMLLRSSGDESETQLAERLRLEVHPALERVLSEWPG
jgi:hypothetical protein